MDCHLNTLNMKHINYIRHTHYNITIFTITTFPSHIN